jgi:hypothetical protein
MFRAPLLPSSVTRILVTTSTVATALLLLSSFNEIAPATAQCGPNPIVCENQLAGSPSSQWNVSGAGSSSLQGFTTDISVNVGGVVRFKVDTTAATFNMDIYRMGYYGGMGARRVAQVTGISGQDQPNCLSNGSTGLVDCGNWAESASWNVPTTAVSGIYFAKLIRPDNGGSSHVVFVVRDDNSTSDLLFQTSDTTWQAYNTFGGNSLYVGSPAGRAYKVSYNRPFNTRAGSPEDWVFNAEYPMVRWLEANGYDVAYTTGVDTDRRGVADLLRHQVFLSVGHDEYWSGGQRANVESARASGMHLAFFSGNEVFWKTRWESSIDGSNTPYRTLVSYKETHANAKIDPTPTWTGTWRDKRFSPPSDGGRPENALTGTIFTVNCCKEDTIRVTGTYRTQPFWRNTRVASLSSTGSTTLTAGMLNYEWDEDLNNGSRPAGLTRLSATTISGVNKLQDNGNTYASGTATHSLTLYRHSSGALVFGAGTVQWSWGLDSNHDRGSAAADTAVRQATVNLFADMGVQPGSLQSGLVPGTVDTTAPGSVITAPTAGTSVTSGVVRTISGTASDTGGGSVASVEVSVNNGTTWVAATGTTSWSYQWTPSGSGSATLRSRATDSSGNRETPSAGVTVTIAPPAPDTTLPNASVTAPAGGSTVSGTINITASASDNVGVVGVQFRRNGVALGAEDTVAPYSIAWNTTAQINGGYLLSAVARDAAGNLGTSADVSVTVNNIPPVNVPPVAGLTLNDATAAITGAGLTVGTLTNGSHATIPSGSVISQNPAGNASAPPNSAVALVISTGPPPADASLVASYNFDTGSGTSVADTTGNGRTGTITGATWSTAGRTGGAMSFDGSGDYVTVADANSLDLTTGMTLQAWVRPSALSGWRTVILKERTGGLAYALYAHDNAPRPAAYINIGGTDRDALGAAQLPLNTWTHLATTYDGTTLRIYVNGTQVGSRAQTGAIGVSTSPLRIGGNVVWGEYFTGLIDDVRVHNRALTAAEIQALMSQPVQ